MFGLPSSYNRNNDLLKGKRKKIFFHRNKQKLIIFSSQAKEMSSYFVVNNQLGEWVGLWLLQTNWFLLVVPPSSSFPTFLEEWCAQLTEGKKLTRHTSGSQVTPWQFLTFGSKPNKTKSSLRLLVRSHNLEKTEYRTVNPLWGTPDLSFLKENWSQMIQIGPLLGPKWNMWSPERHGIDPCNASRNPTFTEAECPSQIL